jgi:O-antigen ligase
MGVMGRYASLTRLLPRPSASNFLSVSRASPYIRAPLPIPPVARSDASPTISRPGFGRTPARAPSTAAPRLRNDPFRLALLALIAISLSRFGGYFSILRLLRPALLLFAFCVCYAFLHRRQLIAKNLVGNTNVRLIVGISFVAVGSTAFGISLGHSALYILNNFSKTLAITFLMMLTVRDVSDVRRLSWAFALGGIVLAYLSIFVIGISKVSGGVSYDANDVGVFMVTMLPVTLLLLQSASSTRAKVLATIGIGLLAVTIVKTQSRGAFIGALVVGVLLLLAPGISTARRLFYVVAASVAMALAAPPGYWQSMQSIMEDPKADYNWDAINGRRNLAKRGIGYMTSYPVFGVGIDNFRIAEGTISDKARNALPGQGVRWASAHNSFVQAGAETGVVGLLLWVGLLLSNIVIPLRLRRLVPKTWRRGTPEQRFVALATLYLPIAQIGFAATAFFVSFAWLEPLFMLSAIVAGLTVVVKRMARAQPAGTPPTATRVGRGMRPPEAPPALSHPFQISS